MNKAAIFFALLLASAACSNGSALNRSRTETHSMNTSIPVAALAGKRIFFGHQSVGYNIVEGVSDLVPKQGGLRIAETSDASQMMPGVLAHSTLGRNGDPYSKIHAFRDLMDSGIGARADIALFKFCYVDVDASTDVARVFEEYRRTMSDLAARYPSTRFVHVTTPLRLVQTGPKALIKRFIGRPAGGYLENIRRNRYNGLLRKEYTGRELVFDLAMVETKTLDGGATTFQHDGEKYFALNPELTPDNGHLNEAGRRLMAEAFLATLSAAR